MSFSSFTGNPNNFLQETYIFPEEGEEYDLKLRQYLGDIASAVNTKDSGLYTNQEVITGQQFLPVFGTTSSSNLTYRDVFRMVVNFGSLPSAATKTVAHGITTTADTSIVKLYGAATDPGASTLTSGIPVPYINTTTPGDSVQLSMDATNISITTTTANYTSYTRCFVIIEYIKIV